MLQENISQPAPMLAGGVTNSIGLVINAANPVSPQNGGSGVSNAFTTTLGGAINTAGAFSTSGANALTLTTTAPTNVTLPTTGTLVNTAVTTLSSLSSIGTITTGVWQGTLIGGQWGGTGVNNGASQIAIGGNVTFSGAFTFGATLTANTSVTFPTSGTLATLGANGVSVTTVAGTSVTMTDNAAINRYVVTNSSLTTLTLPATVAQGHSFEIVGAGAGGWTIAQNAGQSINFQVNGANQATTVGTGGSLSSHLSTDCITIANTTANTTFTLTGIYSGQINYV